MSQGCVTWERDKRIGRKTGRTQVRGVRAIAAIFVSKATIAAASLFMSLVTTRSFWKMQWLNVGDITTSV